MHNLGMVFSGGGVKGAAHIGVLKALEEHDIKPTCVAGTSAGAMAAAFYACGYKSDEVLGLMTSRNFLKFSSLSWAKAGMLEPKLFLKVFADFFRDRTFESLDIELHVATTNIVEGSLRVFTKGPILKPLLASCAFPFIFSPVPIEESLYSDGGIINNFPTESVVKRCKNTLGVYVSPLRKITKEQLRNSIDVADRAYRISNRYESMSKRQQCTWVIEPPELEHYGTFTLSKIKEIFEIGYTYGNQMVERIHSDLE
ncbi:patatin-like phospholipase family protein [Ulvibacterium sp.]|uniref:patatin-like phospholipase family protein n=1 Tax=Ulvibacterium sp. TaxID=2665914 RepID=UPI002629922A|nr:patatin-like phospholipase family protein [Ulvibacterium sp.]